MKLSDLPAATKLAGRLADAESDLENARDGAYLRLQIKHPYPQDGWLLAANEINESAGDDLGTLARDLRQTVIRHYETRRDDLRAQLMALGVEL